MPTFTTGDYCPYCGKLKTECTEHETARIERYQQSMKHDCPKCRHLNASRDSYCAYCGLELWQTNEALLANPETHANTKRFLERNEIVIARLIEKQK